MIGLVLALLGSFAITCCSEHHVSIEVNLSSPCHTTNDKFLSLGMDSNLIRNHWETWNFTSTRLHTLAKGLSPAYLRLFGTDGDRMIFTRNTAEGTLKPLYNSVPSPGPPFPSTNFTMSSKDWDNINKFALDVGWKIMFGFNVQLRNGSNWDSRNAKDLLKYSIQQGYSSNLDFELGNEPDIFPFNKNMKGIPPKQLADDYQQLRNILDTEFDGHFHSAKLRGPGIAFVLAAQEKSNFLFYLRFFLQYLADNVLDSVTWHQYYGGAELNHVDNYTDPRILDQYVKQCEAVVQVVKSTGHKVTIWQGETSSTVDPPHDSVIDESYVAGFMLLDKLGVSARYGMEVVIRQTFYGFWFALVNDKLLPTPNYWVALLYRNLVGNKVLDVTIHGTKSRYIRPYGNCIRKTHMFKDKAVVIYAMNLNNFEISFDFTTVGNHVYEYQFEPGEDNLVSTDISLNGHLLRMSDDTSLPDLVTYGRLRKDSHNVILPSKRFAFYVISDANAEACL